MSGKGNSWRRLMPSAAAAVIAAGVLAGCAHPASDAQPEAALNGPGFLELAAGPAEGAGPNLARARPRAAPPRAPGRMIESGEEAMIAAFLLGVRQDRNAIMYLMR